MRTIIDVSTTQLEALDRWRKREGISRAEAVRRAIAAHVHAHEAGQAGQAFGLWRDRPIDGLEYQAKLRSDWATRPASARRRKR